MDILKAKPKDIDYLLTLADQEGWNPGLDDAQPFYAADPEGYFIGIQLKPVFQTARMYKGVPPKQDLGKIFGVTTFELG
jgi:hypothetical protein